MCINIGNLSVIFYPSKYIACNSYISPIKSGFNNSSFDTATGPSGGYNQSYSPSTPGGGYSYTPPSNRTRHYPSPNSQQTPPVSRHNVPNSYTTSSNIPVSAAGGRRQSREILTRVDVHSSGMLAYQIILNVLMTW